MVLVLLAATFFSGLLEEYYDAITIMVIVILNACPWFFQSIKQNVLLKSYKTHSSPGESNKRWLIYRYCQPGAGAGDLVILEAGDKVGADVRLLEADNLTIDESPLTGRIVGCCQKERQVKKYSASLGDQRNMAFGGTMIASGRGKGGSGNR